MVSGDTGPTHIAAAVGTPIVGIYGPTRPARNGPLAPDDVTVSRDSVCQCHHLRQCRLERMCLLDIEVAEVLAAVERRLHAVAGACPGGAGLSLRHDGATAASKRDTVIGVIARMRVALGFVCGVLVLILAQPTARSLAHRHVDRRARRSASHLGRRASAQVARGDRVRAVPLRAASALCRLVGDGRRPRDRVREHAGRGADRALPRDDADGGDQERGGVPAADVRRAVRSAIAAASPRSGAIPAPRGGGSAWRRRSRTASTARSSGFVVALLLLVWKATYNGSFWRTAGT